MKFPVFLKIVYSTDIIHYRTKPKETFIKLEESPSFSLLTYARYRTAAAGSVRVV